MTTLPDIPRLYTALAEVLAALLYAHRLPPRMDQRVIWGVEAGWAVLLGAFLQATGKVPLAWWIPCMAMAILSMLLFLWVTRSITLLEAGYVCARAFILAELAASVEWQLHCVLWPQRGGAEPLSLLLLAVVYGGIFTAMLFVENRRPGPAGKLKITPAGTFVAVVMALTAFAVSNLSFANGSEANMNMFYIRTLVDLAGVLILTVQHEQLREAALHSELAELDGVLHRQYEQYKQSKENIRLINRRYHELKMQIAAIRAERDPRQAGCGAGGHGKRHPPVRGGEQDRQPGAGHPADGQKPVLPAAPHHDDLRGGRAFAGFFGDRGNLHDCGYGAGQCDRERRDRARPRKAADPGGGVRPERLCDAAV